MVIEAVNRAKSSVSNWEQYDWDGDKKVDQVMIIYAGEGEASGGDASTIWPHEYNLAAANYYGDGSGPVSVGTDLVVDTYVITAKRFATLFKNETCIFPSKTKRDLKSNLSAKKQRLKHLKTDSKAA